MHISIWLPIAIEWFAGIATPALILLLLFNWRVVKTETKLYG